MTRWWWGVAVLLTALLACSRASEEKTTAPTPTAPAWKARCLEATIRALEMERGRFEQWLASETAEASRAVYQRALKRLDACLADYRGLSPADYDDSAEGFRCLRDVMKDLYPWAASSPPRKFVDLQDAWVATTSEVSEPPWMLEYAGMSRSGPFYLVMAVEQGTLTDLEPGKHYRMRLRLLLPAVYPFPEYYVCIVRWAPLPTDTP